MKRIVHRMKNSEHDLKPFKILSDKELQEVNGGSLQYVMSAGPYTWYKDTRTGKTICKNKQLTQQVIHLV